MTVAIPAVSTLKNRFGENVMSVLDQGGRASGTALSLAACLGSCVTLTLSFARRPPSVV
jgi:hypothetical protein